MFKSNFMRIILVIGSIMIIVGVSLMAWMFATEESRNNIVVDISGDGVETIKFEALGLVPGEQCEYTVQLKGENAKEYDLSFDFVEVKEGTLKDFARVQIISGEEVVYDELLADAIEKVDLSLPVDFHEDKNTVLTIVYYMPVEVGNEAKNAEALFELVLVASNE